MVTRSIGRAVAVVFVCALAVVPAGAQPRGAAPDVDLRRQVERRFDVLPLHDGIALRPKSHEVRARSIEVTSTTIAIDGAPVTGAELRDRLGADADLVLRLSYLDPAARRAMFGAGQSPEAATPPPAPPEATAPTAPPPPPDEPTRPERRRRHSRSDARVRIGGTVTVGPDETVTDDVVCIGGSADVQGRVEGNVVVIGGTATLGPAADVSGDVSIVGGVLNRDPSARVGGRINEIGVAGLNGLRLHRFGYWPYGLLAMSPMWHGIALVSTVMRLAVVCILACIVVLLAGRHVEQIGARAAAEPVKAGAIGLLAELLFFPVLVIATVVLVVTIIGIPLLILIPIALLAAVIVALVGYTSVAWTIGRAAASRFGWPTDNRYLVAIVGVVIVIAPVLIARLTGMAGTILLPITGTLLALGFLFEYIVWTVGIGALALARFERPRATTPATPPPPAATPATSS